MVFLILVPEGRRYTSEKEDCSLVAILLNKDGSSLAWLKIAGLFISSLY